MNFNRSLVIRGSRKDFALACRHCRIPLNESREPTTESLNAKRQRCHIEQEHIFDLATEHTCLNRGAYGNDLVRIDTLVRLFAEQLAYDLLDFRNSRAAA